MKAHKNWSVLALITMLGAFITGHTGSKSGHKFFACTSLFCMVMAICSGHKMISGKKKPADKEITAETEEETTVTEDEE